MILTGQQKEILKEGILGAYPTEDELKILLSEKMNLRYSAIAKGENYISRVAFLVEKLEADGRVKELIKVIIKEKPDSPFLTQIKDKILNIDELILDPSNMRSRRSLLQGLGILFFSGVGATFIINIFKGKPNNLKKLFGIKYQNRQIEDIVTVTVNESGQTINEENASVYFFDEKLADGINLRMIAIPEGQFWMGTLDDEITNLRNKYPNYSEYFQWETPQHLVKVKSFYIGKFSVTQAQWKMLALRQDLRSDIDLNPDPAHFRGDNRPVEQVTWDDAIEFCSRLTVRSFKKETRK